MEKSVSQRWRNTGVITFLISSASDSAVVGNHEVLAQAICESLKDIYWMDREFFLNEDQSVVRAQSCLETWHGGDFSSIVIFFLYILLLQVYTVKQPCVVYSVAHGQSTQQTEPLIKPIQPLKMGNEQQVWHTLGLKATHPISGMLTMMQLRLLGLSSGGALELTF